MSDAGGTFPSRCTCRTPTRSARAIELRPLRRGGRASTPCGRPTAGSCATPSCRWPRSPRRPTAIKIGSGVIDIWTRNPARLASTFSTLDDLAPGPDHLRPRRVVGPAGRARSASTATRPLHGDARGRHRRARACSPTRPSRSTASYVHLDGVELDYVYQERRPKDVPIYIGATGMQMMELTGEIADGVVLNYLVSPDVQRAGAWTHLAAGRGQGRAARSTTSTARSSSCARVDDDRQARARRRPPARHPVPRPAAAHHEGVGRAAGAARRDRQGAHVAGHPRPGRRGEPSSCPTTSCR